MIWYNGLSKAKIKGDLNEERDEKQDLRQRGYVKCYFLQCENVSITPH
jgi:hypothetical protein